MDDLISRKALIAEYDRVHVGPPGGARKLMEDAPSVEPKPKWIPCKERLPEITHFYHDVCPFSDEVLLAVRNEYGADQIIISSYDSDGRWNYSGLDYRFKYKPLAWMPLPSPYKGGTP